ncbi:phospholipid scramblase 2-like [Periplaneta americana]|uniref:phospholipid scramblase 2-like n=1 Tax=Periplaneta americana TaxID=6978 RepID=UPI0037E91607
MADPPQNPPSEPEEVDGDPQILAAQNLNYSDYLDMPVFEQRTVITSQPNAENNPNRRPIPISTMGWQSTSLNHMVPPSGLDFMRGVVEVSIQQTVELIDILAYVESENRFQVKVPQGETLYVAAESSSKTQRMCCASNRGFEMRLFDHSQQEALRFTRKLACSSWLFGCCLQELQVFSDVDLYAGSVVQEWSVGAPTFQLQNSSGQIVYRLVGPASATTCCGSNYQAKFDVVSPDCTTSMGSIVHAWDNMSSDYNLTVTFPTVEVTTEMKGVILGAAFLLEYMYFETSKRRGILATLTCKTC